MVYARSGDGVTSRLHGYLRYRFDGRGAPSSLTALFVQTYVSSFYKPAAGDGGGPSRFPFLLREPVRRTASGILNSSHRSHVCRHPAAPVADPMVSPCQAGLACLFVSASDVRPPEICGAVYWNGSASLVSCFDPREWETGLVFITPTPADGNGRDVAFCFFR